MYAVCSEITENTEQIQKNKIKFLNLLPAGLPSFEATGSSNVLGHYLGHYPL